MKVVSLVIALLLIVLLVAVVRAISLVVRPRKRSAGIFDLVLFAGTGVIGITFCYALLVEPRMLQTSQVVVHSGKVQPGERLRIVQFSDLHSPSNLAVQQQLEAAIRGLSPDIIVFTGDLSNSAEGLQLARSTLKEISDIAPTYAIRGDLDSDLDDDLFGGTGVVELHGLAVPIKVRQTDVNMVGWSQQKDWKLLYGTLSHRNREILTLFLGHSPDYAEDISRWGADVYLAGHTHGGQVAIPFYGALWTASLYGKKYEAGKYRVGEMDLYINRGIGMAKGLPPVRFLSSPELTLYIIKR